MVNDFLKQRGIREKSRIVYTYPAPSVFGIKQANDMFLEMFKERGIEVISPFIVDYIEGIV